MDLSILISPFIFPLAADLGFTESLQHGVDHCLPLLVVDGLLDSQWFFLLQNLGQRLILIISEQER